ncbi:MAG TPA: hypothetical protein PLU53_01315 [Bacteroidia bacterium]|nr:hypothetical protein [Bacteroidia bacterium]
MNKERSGLITGWVMVCLFGVMTFFSCKKDGPTRAIVTVIDSLGRPVQAASVTLWQDTAVNATNGVQANIRVTKSSDAAGKAEFEFEQEAFLNYVVIKNADTARGFIRLKEHETVNETANL